MYCKTCIHWQSPNEKIGECKLTRRGKPETLTSWVIRRRDGYGWMPIDPSEAKNMEAALMTHAEFGCVCHEEK